MRINPTKSPNTQTLIHALNTQAHEIVDTTEEYDSIVEAAKDKRLVLIGEASHGTKEFYHTRAQITQRLIEECGFDAIAVEADWPDAYAINRFVSTTAPTISAEEALAVFERFPTWMWANAEVLSFVEWLSAFNQSPSLFATNRTRPVGFYGLDLYSMSTSIHAVVEYLEGVDPDAAERARQRYACLDHFIDDPQAYGQATEFGLVKSCEQEIIEQLIEMRHKAYDYMKLNGFVAGDEYFCAEQNAKLVRNAETYYRSIYRGRQSSWNIRDQHMYETLKDLAGHVSRQQQHPARLIVWAHNSHVGNAAATEMSRRHELNIGQLVRESFGEDALHIGFSTCRGTVSAASNWDAPIEKKRVRAPLPDSYEDVFHRVNFDNFYVNLRENNEATELLREPRLQRAIGVIYRPESERTSHYFYACLPQQFDFIIHFDETSAVEPLDIPVHWHRGELDETYPSGL